MIKLENIRIVNYVETTVEWEQWAVADSDWVTLIWVWFVTVECFCDREEQSTEFQNKIQWAFLKSLKFTDLKKFLNR